MSFQKKHAIRDLKAGSAAQDIDDNFDALFAAIRALRTQFNELAEETDDIPVIDPALFNKMGPPGIPGADGEDGLMIIMQGAGAGGGGGLTTDYVVLSDGGLPTPLPVDDGFGNFIYVAYTP